MLGSAIPRRWIFSLALVGLVSIFAVSYSAVWSNPASAQDSQGPGTGTGNSVPLDPSGAQTLDSADPLPTGLTMAPGQQLQISLNLIDLTGAENDSLPNVTFNWSVVSGPVTLLGPTNTATVVVQANGTGSATIRGVATQIQETQDYLVIREMTFNIASPSATTTPVTPPTNPGTPPSSIPNAQGVVTPEGRLLVSSTGVESGNSAESAGLQNRPVLFIQQGSVNNFFGVNVASVDPATLPAMPSRYIRGSSAANIKFYDASGVEQTNFRLLRSARICLPTASSDRANGITNLRVLRYNSAVNQWVELTTTYNTITRQACANSSNFSNFAVGVLQIQPTPGPGGGLPATGGWSPSAGLLVFTGILGVALVGGGVVSLRRARGGRPE